MPWPSIAINTIPPQKPSTNSLLAKVARTLQVILCLGELITQLYRLLPVNQAEPFVGTVLAACDAAEYRLVHVSPDQFRRAWQLRRQFADKPDISFVDLSSMVVVQDLDLEDVFTGDDDFRRVNLGFRLYP